MLNLKESESDYILISFRCELHRVRLLHIHHVAVCLSRKHDTGNRSCNGVHTVRHQVEQPNTPSTAPSLKLAREVEIWKISGRTTQTLRFKVSPELATNNAMYQLYTISRMSSEINAIAWYIQILTGLFRKAWASGPTNVGEKQIFRKSTHTKDIVPGNASICICAGSFVLCWCVLFYLYCFANILCPETTRE